MARLVHNLPPHCVPPPWACVGEWVGWIWPIFESDEKNEKERVLQWGRVISWTCRSSESEGAREVQLSGLRYRCCEALAAAVTERRKKRGNGLSIASVSAAVELHRKHCMCMRLSPDLSASHTACIVLQGVTHTYRLGLY